MWFLRHSKLDRQNDRHVITMNTFEYTRGSNWKNKLLVYQNQLQILLLPGGETPNEHGPKIDCKCIK